MNIRIQNNDYQVIIIPIWHMDTKNILILYVITPFHRKQHAYSVKQPHCTEGAKIDAVSNSERRQDCIKEQRAFPLYN